MEKQLEDIINKTDFTSNKVKQILSLFEKKIDECKDEITNYLIYMPVGKLAQCDVITNDILSIIKAKVRGEPDKEEINETFNGRTIFKD